MLHSFNPEYAEKYGVIPAVILQNLIYWIAKNKANNRHIYDGYAWTYNSVKAFSELFPYLTSKQIRTALKKLEDDGVITTGNYNQSSYDRTKWYAVIDESILRNENLHLPIWSNENAPEGKPIPDNKPDSKQNKKQNKKNESEKEHIGLSPKQQIEGVGSLEEPTTNKKMEEEKKKEKPTKERKRIFEEKFESERILTFRDKINISKCKFERGDDIEKIASLFTDYVKQKRGYARRLDKFLIAYREGRLEDIGYIPKKEEEAILW